MWEPYSTLVAKAVKDSRRRVVPAIVVRNNKQSPVAELVPVSEICDSVWSLFASTIDKRMVPSFFFNKYGGAI